MLPKDHSLLLSISIFIFCVLPFIYLPVTQDPELSLRYLVLSVFLTGVTLFYLYKANSSSIQQVSVLPIALFGGYVLFSAFTILRTINTGDGIYEWSKLLVCLITLILISIASRNNIKFHEKIPLLFTISTFFFSVFSMIQLMPLVIKTLFEGGVLDIGTLVTSTLSNKNFLAETLLVSLPFTIYSTITISNKLKYITGLVSLISLILILILQSAAVYLAAMFTAGFMILVLVIYRKKLGESPFRVFLTPKSIIIAFCTFSAIIILLTQLPSGKVEFSQLSIKWNAVTNYFQNPDSIFETNNDQNNNSVYDRLFLARNSIKMAAEHPVFGNGIANWKILLPKYGMYGNSFMSVGRLRYEHPHNDYLLVLCESGWVGLIFWVSFLVSLIYIAARKLQNGKNSSQKLLAFFSMASIVAFMVLSTLSYPKERFFTMMMLIVVSGLLVTNESDEKRNINLPPKTILFVCLLVLVAVSSIQFLRYRSEIYLFKALNHQKRSEFREMQNSLVKAESSFHSIDMTGTPLSWHLGQAYYYQGNHQMAFNKYKQAVLENPFHMQALNDLGALYEAQGKHEDALSCFNRVFEINSDFPDTKMNMAALYFNTGDVEKAYVILKTHIYKHTPKWREDMKIILLSKAEKMVQSNQDTALADLLNVKLSKNPNFLMSVFFEAEKDSISFEDGLHRLERSRNK